MLATCKQTCLGLVMGDQLTIALSKGRIFQDALPLFARLGITLLERPDTSRKLILETSDRIIRFIIVRASDVPTYVAHGVAEMGVAGKDVLMEYQGQSLYEPLDLNIATCHMVLAGLEGRPAINGRARIATKYIQTTRNYFAGQGKQVELIRLYGSMELAPVLGLADQIVDLVDTGKTLKANGLEVIETIAAISSRLIINKAAMKIKGACIKPIIHRLEQAIARP